MLKFRSLIRRNYKLLMVANVSKAGTFDILNFRRFKSRKWQNFGSSDIRRVKFA